MRRTPDNHAPNCKNRSSKHLIPLTKMKSVYRSMSGEMLMKLSNTSGDPKAKRELERRNNLNRNRKEDNA